MKTVAEGVEDEATLRRLAEDGVAVAQGFHIARPLPAAELEAWLRARAESGAAVAWRRGAGGRYGIIVG